MVLKWREFIRLQSYRNHLLLIKLWSPHLNLIKQYQWIYQWRLRQAHYLTQLNVQIQQSGGVGGGICKNPSFSPPLPPSQPGDGGGGGGGGGGEGSIRPGSMVDRARLANLPLPEPGLNCPRCDSTNTKFCFFNNYSLTQPQHFCKTCRRYWARGGALRNVPIGGGCRRYKRSSKSRSSKSPNRSGPKSPSASQVVTQKI